MRQIMFAAVMALVLACGTGCASKQETAPSLSQEVSETPAPAAEASPAD